MSKSEQKRICVQTECAVRDELREQLDAKDKENEDNKGIIKVQRDTLLSYKPSFEAKDGALLDLAKELVVAEEANALLREVVKELKLYVNHWPNCRIEVEGDYCDCGYKALKAKLEAKGEL